jgi:catecholate siderophore receptor
MKTNRFFQKWLKRRHSPRRAKRSHSGLRFSQAVALTVAMGMGSPLRAEETATPPAGTTTQSAMPEVVVTGQQQRSYKPESSSSPKFSQPLLDVPQTVTVVPQAAIAEQNANTLRDVLRNVPGISIQAGEGGVPAGDNLAIRGFNARTDIFIDGIRDFGGYSRDTFNIEQVEVIKGPSSSFGGRGSTGGAINMASKYATSDSFTNATLGLGTDSYQRGTIDVNRPIAGKEGTAVRLTGVWHAQDVAGRNAVDAERWGLSPSVSFGIGTPTRLDIGFFHLSQDNLPDYGIPWVPATNTALSGYGNQPPPVNYENFYGLRARDYEKTETNIGTVKVQHDASDTLSIRNITRYGQTDRDSLITAPRFASDASTTINRNLQSRDQVDSILANQTDVTVKFDTAKVNHTVVTGVDLSREESENYARSGPAAPTADLFNPNPNDTYTGLITRTGARTEAIAQTQAAYAFDTMKFGEQFELSGGARWDSFKVDYESDSTASATTPLHRTDDMISWRAGAVYKPLPNGSVYAAYGTSFNPSAEGLTLANTATATNNINTDPEESRTFEIGTKWEVIKRKLLTSLAVFRTEKTNARTEDPANPADVIVLDGEQRVDGVEVGAAGNLTDAWTLFGGYTYLDGKVVSSNNPLEVGRELSNTPRHSFSAWSTYQLPANFDIGAGMQYVDKRFNSTTTPRLAPSYWTMDAMAAYKVNDNFTLRLNAYNLFDEEYIDRVGGGHFIPGSGRAAVLTTEVKF